VVESPIIDSRKVTTRIQDLRYIGLPVALTTAVLGGVNEPT
jgi:hypothetical protein